MAREWEVGRGRAREGEGGLGDAEIKGADKEREEVVAVFVFDLLVGGWEEEEVWDHLLPVEEEVEVVEVGGERG